MVLLSLSFMLNWGAPMNITELKCWAGSATNMTGKEIAATLRKATGKIMAPMLTPNESPFIVVEKKSLIEWALEAGDLELDMSVVTDEHGTYLTTDVKEQ